MASLRLTFPRTAAYKLYICVPANEHGCMSCVHKWTFTHVQVSPHVQYTLPPAPSPKPTPNDLSTHVCVCMRGMLVVSKLSGWMGGTTSPLTGLKTGKVERGQEISRFLDMLRSSLLDFWMELWWTSWMLERGDGSSVRTHKLMSASGLANVSHPVCNASLTGTDLKNVNMQSVGISYGELRTHVEFMQAQQKYHIHPDYVSAWLSVQ